MLKVSFTNHAKDMLKERKFTEEEIVFALSERDWSENDEIETEKWHAFKKFGDKVLRVVVKGREEPYIIIRMFYDRRLRNQK